MDQEALRALLQHLSQPLVNIVMPGQGATVSCVTTPATHVLLTATIAQTFSYLHPSVLINFVNEHNSNINYDVAITCLLHLYIILLSVQCNGLLYYIYLHLHYRYFLK